MRRLAVSTSPATSPVPFPKTFGSQQENIVIAVKPHVGAGAGRAANNYGK